MKAAINRARREAGVLGDAGNRGPLNPVLPQHLGGGLLQFAQ